MQGCSLGDGNVIEVYASGADFNNANVLYREFMSAGEPICFTGLSSGAIITSTQGFYGVSEQVIGNGESPMPLLSLGLAFTGTFLYAFRNSQHYPGEGNSTGQITVVNGPLPSTVTFTKNGAQVRDQEPRDLEPFELTHSTLTRTGSTSCLVRQQSWRVFKLTWGHPRQQQRAILRRTSRYAPDQRRHDLAPLWIRECALRQHHVQVLRT